MISNARWIRLTVVAFVMVTACMQLAAQVAALTRTDIQRYEGLWVEENYLAALRDSHSCYAARKAASPTVPIAIRISSREWMGDSLHVGYSQLHDHDVHPDVRDSVVLADGSIAYAQGSTHWQLSGRDSAGWRDAGYLGNWFNWERPAYYRFVEDPDMRLLIHRDHADRREPKELVFRRVTNQIPKDMPYLNPLYWATRRFTFGGSYVLMDSLGKCLSKQITIAEDGRVLGIPILNGCRAICETEFYCGMPPMFDQVMLLRGMEYLESFKLDRLADGTLTLSRYAGNWTVDDGLDAVDYQVFAPCYRLLPVRR